MIISIWSDKRWADKTDTPKHPNSQTVEHLNTKHKTSDLNTTKPKQLQSKQLRKQPSKQRSKQSSKPALKQVSKSALNPIMLTELERWKSAISQCNRRQSSTQWWNWLPQSGKENQDSWRLGRGKAGRDTKITTWLESCLIDCMLLILIFGCGFLLEREFCLLPGLGLIKPSLELIHLLGWTWAGFGPSHFFQCFCWAGLGLGLS